MAIEFKLPELGENIESADVINVLVKKGDTIEKDQSVIEIETDKATVEVPSNVSGKISEVLVKQGDNVKVGQTLIKVEDERVEAEAKTESKKKDTEKIEEKKEKQAEAKSEVERKVQPSEKSKSEIVEFKLPDLGENIESADVISVLVKKGDHINIDQSIIEIETDKATVEVPSSIEGKVVDVLVKEKSKAKVGDTLIKVETSGVTQKKEIESKVPAKDEQKVSVSEIKTEQKPKEVFKGELSSLRPGELDEQPPIARGSAPAAPSVRRIARELGVDINKVPGSGEGGRISMDDVKTYVKKIMQGGFESVGPGIKKEALPDFSKFGSVEVVEMTKIRKTTAEHLSYAWATIPHVTQSDKADITQFEKTRKELSPEVEKEGGKLTVTSILLKIIYAALKEFPQFNSSINMETKQIIFKNYYNIGVAVDTEHGLIVPVIKNVDKKKLVQLSIELGELAKKARERKISLEELQGGCFTITNLGGIGGTYFSPIINSPEVAILGVSRRSYEPVYNNHGVFEPRLMLPLSLSYDHRIIDGADAIRFLRFVVEALENPIKLLI